MGLPVPGGRDAATCEAAAVPRRAAFLFCLASVAWGMPYLLAALTLDDLAPIVTVFARAALAAAVLVPLAVRRGALRSLRGRGRDIAWLALLDLTAPTLLVTQGLETLPSSVAGTLVASVPLAVAGLAWRLDAGERATGWRLVGLLVGLGGVGVLLGFQVSGDPRAFVGSTLVLAAAACYAAGALFYKRRFAESSPLGVVAVALVACMAMCAVPAALALPSDVPSARSIGAVALLGLGCTGGGYIAFYTLITMIGAGRAAVITYVAPAIAVVAGVALLDEPLTAAGVAGLLLVLAGSWLATGGRPPGLRKGWLSTRCGFGYAARRRAPAPRSMPRTEGHG